MKTWITVFSFLWAPFISHAGGEAPDLSFAGLVIGFQSEFIQSDKVHPQLELFTQVFPSAKSILIKPIHEKDEKNQYSPGLTERIQLHLMIDVCRKNQPCEEQLYSFPVESRLNVKNDVLGIHYDLSHMEIQFKGYTPISKDGTPVTLYVEVKALSAGSDLQNDAQSQVGLMEYYLVLTDGKRTEKLRLIPRMFFS